MRLFIAVPVAENIRRRAAELLVPLRQTNADFKWVDPGNLHLTLVFLGETPDSRLPEIEALMGQAARRPHFDIVFGGLGAFPSTASPRVVWWGLERGSEGLAEMARLLSPLAARQEEHPFSAHLTLGRQRSRRDLQRLQKALAELQAAPLLQRVDRIVLFRSQLTPQGPLYREVTSRGLSS